jgi:polyhydroxyalkanoate synthesis regulator phasin
MKSIPNKLTSKIDKPLDKQITRTDDPLPKTTRGLIYIISGRKGSGKTSLMINLLRNKKEGGYKKYFDNIWLISPTARTDEKMSKLVNELDEDGKYYDSLTGDTLDDVTNLVKEYNNEHEKEEPRNLLIIDDCMCDLPPRQSKSILNKIVVLARHYKLSVWFLVQKYNSINTLIRSNADIISFFKTDNEKEYKTLEDDIFINSNLFRYIYDYATDEGPNSFLHINLLSNPPTFYKKFDKIIID